MSSDSSLCQHLLRPCPPFGATAPTATRYHALSRLVPAKQRAPCDLYGTSKPSLDSTKAVPRPAYACRAASEGTNARMSRDPRCRRRRRHAPGTAHVLTGHGHPPAQRSVTCDPLLRLHVHSMHRGIADAVRRVHAAQAVRAVRLVGSIPSITGIFSVMSGFTFSFHRDHHACCSTCPPRSRALRALARVLRVGRGDRSEDGGPSGGWWATAHRALSVSDL